MFIFRFYKKATLPGKHEQLNWPFPKLLQVPIIKQKILKEFQFIIVI